MGHWCDLQPELLEEISERILSNSIVDYIRSGAVCKPWRSIFGIKPRRGIRPLIMEILPVSAGYDRCCRFFNIGGNVLHRFDHHSASYLDMMNYKGCGYGWVITSDNYRPKNDFLGDRTSEGIYLLNPITRQEIYLPSLATVSKTMVLLLRAAISSIPTLDKNGVSCIVIAHCVTMGSVWLLIFCKLGDDKWNIIEDSKGFEGPCLRGLIHCDGVFYMLNSKGALSICDVGASNPRIKPFVEASKLFDGDDSICNSLMESCGELLFIRWYRTLDCHIVKVVVLKLEKNSQVWSEVKSIGDRSLLVTDKSSISILASDHPELKKNCIYIITSNVIIARSRNERRCGIFNIADGNLEYITSNLEPPCLDGFWIMPSW